LLEPGPGIDFVEIGMGKRWEVRPCGHRI
jgi:hypothetical protein